MSPRDLPLWVRGAGAALVLGAGWYTTRSEALRGLIGESVLEVSAAVVAIMILMGTRVPLELWTANPRRSTFSLVWAVAAAAVMAALVGWAGQVPIADEVSIADAIVGPERGLILSVLAGAAAWAVAWGHTSQNAYARWFGWAALAGLAPTALTMLVAGFAPGAFPVAEPFTTVRIAIFLSVAGAAAALVTQELAFRRMLVGQAGDAGLATVVLAAVLFGVWRALVPDPPGGIFRTVVEASLHGVVAGSLYLLCRSLLVSALYHGVHTGARWSWELTVSADTPDDWWFATGVTGAIAVGLSVLAARRSGWIGILRRREVPDAPRD